MHSIRKFKYYLSLALVQFTNFCLMENKVAFEETVYSLYYLQLIGTNNSSGNTAPRQIRDSNLLLDNDRRRNAVPFICPGNGHLYLKFTNDTFAKNICAWIGSVSDCYTMQTSSKNINFSHSLNQIHWI